MDSAEGPGDGLDPSGGGTAGGEPASLSTEPVALEP